MHKDLDSILRTQNNKLGTVASVCNPSSEEVETWIPGALWPVSLAYLLRSRSLRNPIPLPPQKKHGQQVRNDSQGCPFASTCVHMCTTSTPEHVHKHTCTQTHRRKHFVVICKRHGEKKERFFPEHDTMLSTAFCCGKTPENARLKKKTKNQICVLIHSFRGSDTDTIRDFLLRKLLWRTPKAMDIPQITGESTNQTSVMGTLFYSVMMMSVFPIKVRST